MVNASRSSLSGKIAALSRSRDDDDPEYIEARRDLKALNLEEYVKRAVDAFPPLTQAQVDRVVTILRSRSQEL